VPQGFASPWVEKPVKPPVERPGAFFFLPQVFSKFFRNFLEVLKN
jgi:hypothetical protein